MKDWARMNTRIEYHGPLDVFGRCHFSLHWMDSYFPGHPDGEHIVRERGQHFHADPHAYGHLRPGGVTYWQAGGSK
jgi:hypothetical protein